jgi:hypothetical protein
MDARAAEVWPLWKPFMRLAGPGRKCSAIDQARARFCPLEFLSTTPN